METESVQENSQIPFFVNHSNIYNTLTSTMDKHMI